LEVGEEGGGQGVEEEEGGDQVQLPVDGDAYGDMGIRVDDSYSNDVQPVSAPSPPLPPNLDEANLEEAGEAGIFVDDGDRSDDAPDGDRSDDAPDGDRSDDAPDDDAPDDDAPDEDAPPYHPRPDLPRPKPTQSSLHTNIRLSLDRKSRASRLSRWNSSPVGLRLLDMADRNISLAAPPPPPPPR
jgi:hypothetical protein